MEDGDSHITPVLTTTGDQCSTNSEDAPLLTNKKERLWWYKYSLRYRNARKCVSSKAALLILFWSFVLGLWNGVALSPDLYLRTATSILMLSGYVFTAIVFCFFPLAGFLADVKYGRYKTIIRSLFLVLVSIPALILLSGVGVAFGISVLIPVLGLDSAPLVVFYILIVSILALGILVIFISSYVGLAGFTANVVQFGMDQLHDSPGEDRTLFIHWYVWVYYITIVIGQLSWTFALQLPYTYYSDTSILGYVLLASIFLVVIIILSVTLCLAKHRRSWFLIEPGRVNPYQLVYRVTKFAYQHKTPVHRSAFTYCEDEIPRGLDLGKEKYGGCFTTEQVEDVKVFYGVLKVLFSFGLVFFLDFAASSVLPMYALHYTMPDIYIVGTSSKAEIFLLNSSLVSPLLIAICIPLYLCLLRPFMSHCLPGMLKRMGIGMVLVLMSLITTVAMDTVAHNDGRALFDHNYTFYFNYSNKYYDHCMFHPNTILYIGNSLEVPPQQNPLILLVQLSLSALSHMLIYIAIFEFICSQSPHSMKGLLIGLLYAIKGLYQVLATILVVPFALGYFKHPSCGFYYYLVNIVVGLIAVAVYVCVAKRYRYRERDEPCNIRRYAEEYYSNPQQEQYYDYD